VFDREKKIKDNVTVVSHQKKNVMCGGEFKSVPYRREEVSSMWRRELQPIRQIHAYRWEAKKTSATHVSYAKSSSC
jgi:hypothetical protein